MGKREIERKIKELEKQIERCEEELKPFRNKEWIKKNKKRYLSYKKLKGTYWVKSTNRNFMLYHIKDLKINRNDLGIKYIYCINDEFYFNLNEEDRIYVNFSLNNCSDGISFYDMAIGGKKYNRINKKEFNGYLTNLQKILGELKGADKEGSANNG